MVGPDSAAMAFTRMKSAITAFAANPRFSHEYRLNGYDPFSGMDCSGFAGWILNEMGINLRRSGEETARQLAESVFTRNSPDPELGDAGRYLSAFFGFSGGGTGLLEDGKRSFSDRDGWHIALPYGFNRVAHFSSKRKMQFYLTSGADALRAEVNDKLYTFTDKFGSITCTWVEYLFIRATACTIRRAGTPWVTTGWKHEYFKNGRGAMGVTDFRTALQIGFGAIWDGDAQDFGDTLATGPLNWSSTHIAGQVPYIPLLADTTDIEDVVKAVAPMSLIPSSVMQLIFAGFQPLTTLGASGLEAADVEYVGSFEVVPAMAETDALRAEPVPVLSAIPRALRERASELQSNYLADNAYESPLVKTVALVDRDANTSLFNVLDALQWAAFQVETFNPLGRTLFTLAFAGVSRVLGSGVPAYQTYESIKEGESFNTTPILFATPDEQATFSRTIAEVDANAWDDQDNVADVFREKMTSLQDLIPEGFQVDAAFLSLLDDPSGRVAPVNMASWADLIQREWQMQLEEDGVLPQRGFTLSHHPTADPQRTVFWGSYCQYRRESDDKIVTEGTPTTGIKWQERWLDTSLLSALPDAKENQVRSIPVRIVADYT